MADAIRYAPVVAVLDVRVIAQLQPTVDRLAVAIEGTWGYGSRVAARLSGWTPEMLAWGRMLAALADAGVDLEIGTSDG